MIEEIHIRDLGVITDARLPLQPGLSVLTGETGAGKTDGCDRSWDASRSPKRRL